MGEFNRKFQQGLDGEWEKVEFPYDSEYNLSADEARKIVRKEHPDYFDPNTFDHGQLEEVSDGDGNYKWRDRRTGREIAHYNG
jgi:hypothetical protein